MANDGREPSLSESEELMQQLLIDVRLSGGGTYWGDSGAKKLWTVEPEQLHAAYVNQSDIELSNIPVRDRTEIINALRGTGQVPSEANIIANYLNRLSSTGMEVR